MRLEVTCSISISLIPVFNSSMADDEEGLRRKNVNSFPN